MKEPSKTVEYKHVDYLVIRRIGQTTVYMYLVCQNENQCH